MADRRRSDPTFPIFVVLAAIFIFALMYATFPRHEGATMSAAERAPATAKK
jgi:hypothetical protein